MKKLSDYKEKEFLLLSEEDIKEIIGMEIEFYLVNDADKSKYIRDVILERFDRKFYTGALKHTLYKDLKFISDKQFKYFKNEIEKKKREQKDIELNKKLSEEFQRRERRKNTANYRYLIIMRNQLIGSLFITLLSWKYLSNILNITSSPLSNNPFIFLLISLCIWGLIQISLAPFDIAWARRHPSAWGILIVNVCVPIIGWIVALIWSCSQIEQRIIVVNEKDLK